MKQMNDIERVLMTKMVNLDSFKKFATELLIELILHGTIKERSDDEITQICKVLYDDLAEQEKETKQSLN